MNYYVIGPDGSKYGPADINTLNGWAIEGRVMPHTILENVATGQQMAASTVPGITFPGQFSQPYAQPPMGPQYGSTYQRPTMGYGYDPRDLNKAWWLGVGGLCCCGPLGIWGLIVALEEKKKGNPNAQAAVIFNAVAIALWFAWAIGGRAYSRF